LKLCNFKGYNRKHPKKPVELTEAEEQTVQAFKVDAILPTIMRSLPVFEEWWNEKSEIAVELEAKMKAETEAPPS
jgi:hypothetical protein